MKRYLAIPGCLLLIAALMRATVNARWDTPNIWLAAAGALILAVTVAWNWQEVVDWLRDPRGIFAVTTGISVAVFVAILVMVNIAVWYNPWSLDLTASGRNEVSEDTRRILGRLEAPVELMQFGRDPDPRVEQLLRSFERETQRLRVQFVDSDRQADLARQYGVLRNGTRFGFVGDIGRLPNTLAELAAQSGLPSYSTTNIRSIGMGWRGPYINSGTSATDYQRDAFGRLFVLNSGQVRSYGPDGIANNTDDIVYPPTAPVVTGTVAITVKTIVSGKTVVDPANYRVDLYYANGGTQAVVSDASAPFTFANVPMGLHAARVIKTNNPNNGSTMVEDTVVVRPGTTNAAELWF